MPLNPLTIQNYDRAVPPPGLPAQSCGKFVLTLDGLKAASIRVRCIEGIAAPSEPVLQDLFDMRRSADRLSVTEIYSEPSSTNIGRQPPSLDISIPRNADIEFAIGDTARLTIIGIPASIHGKLRGHSKVSYFDKLASRKPALSDLNDQIIGKTEFDFSLSDESRLKIEKTSSREPSSMKVKTSGESHVALNGYVGDIDHIGSGKSEIKGRDLTITSDQELLSNSALTVYQGHFRPNTIDVSLCESARFNVMGYRAGVPFQAVINRAFGIHNANF